MKNIITIILFLIFSSIVIAQDKTAMNRHKFYDQSKKENLTENHSKYKNRRLTVDVDSTGIGLYAWGDECYFKINLLQRMLINANFYDVGVFNNAPSMRYGNDNFKFRMYINNGGNFEFDAKIMRKSPNGRYKIPFRIETKGLNFYYQDTLMDSVKHYCFRPDSVVGSYAIYHKSGLHNTVHADGAESNYGTGKAFHLYAKKAWDSSGDTVKAIIEIDTVRNLMFIGADSTWMANAVYPVTIDPDIGNTVAGASEAVLTDSLDKFIHWRHFIYSATSNGTLTTAYVYRRAYFTQTNADNYTMAVYTHDSGFDSTACDFVGKADWDLIPTAATEWVSGSFSSGSVVSGTNYVVGYSHRNNNIGTNLRNMYDGSGTYGDNLREDTDTDLNWDATLGNFYQLNGNLYSWYASFTEDGGATSSPRRKKIIRINNK